MEKKVYSFIGLIILLLISSMFISCSKDEELVSTYSMDEFQDAMSDKGYDFEVQDVEEDFLLTTRKRMTIDDTVIDIYLFNNDKAMEKEAAYIDSDGYGYDNGIRRLKVSWINAPHFYKKGSLIIQYVGEEKNIMSSLEDILGQQFAGL